MKVGITSSPYFGFYGYEEGLKKMKSHGYDCVDYQNFASPEGELLNLGDGEFENYLKDFGATAKGIGISFYQAHGLWPTDDITKESRERQFPYYIKGIIGASIIGCENLVLHPVMPYGWKEETDPAYSWALNEELFSKLLPYAEKYGVTLCLENIPISMRLHSPYEVKKFVTSFGSDHLKICFDTGHFNLTKYDLTDALKTLGDDLRVLHIHDNKGRNDDHILPYTGTFKWDEFISALAAIGFDGCFSLETCIRKDTPDDVKEEAQRAIAKVARMMADKVESLKAIR